MPTIYKVLHFPHVLLKKKSTRVEKFSDELRTFVQNLITTANIFEGGGIAAPQVGVTKRIFISDFTQVFQKSDQFEKTDDDFLVFDETGKPLSVKFPMVFINPEFRIQEDPISTNWEGCLSFPNAESFSINRYHKVEIQAQNEYGQKFLVRTSHLYAAVNFQHEIDHLDGLLMSDRWNKSSFNEKDVVSDIKNFEDQASERKKIKKLNLVDASKIKFDFL